MTILSRSLLPVLAGLSSSLLPAQVPPGASAAVEKDTVFTQANLQNLGLYRAGATNKAITQINFTKTPGIDLAGEYTVALTLQDLAPAYGGSASGGEFVVFGRYDSSVSPQTFVPNTQANAMNDPANGPCRTLMMEPRDAICCTVGQSDGIWFSIRKTTTDVFPAPVRVTTASGTPTIPGTYIDAVPCYIDGVLTMIYTDKAKEVVAREIVPQWSTSGNLVGAVLQKAVVIAGTARPPHSPTPIIDGDGNVQGLWMAVGDASDSDMYFQAGLTAKDKALEMFGGSTFKGHGGVCGGRLFYVSSGEVYFGRSAWLLGSNTPVGNFATAVICADNPTRPFSVFYTYLAVSAKWNAGVHAGVAVPGFNGLYALEDPMLRFFDAFVANIDDTVYWQAQVPNDPNIIGTRLSFQGLAAPKGQLPTLTNSATFEFR